MNLKFRIVPNAMPASQGEAKYLGIIVPNGVRNRALMVKSIIAREHFSESTVNAVLDAAIAETEALCAEGRDVSWGPVKFISKMHGSFPYEDSAFEDGTASVTVDAEGTNTLRALFADVVPTPMSAEEVTAAVKVSNVMDIATERFGEIHGTDEFEILGNGVTLDAEGESAKLLDRKTGETLATAETASVERGQRAVCSFAAVPGGIAAGAYTLEVTTFGLVGETTPRVFRKPVTLVEAIPAPERKPFTFCESNGSTMVKLLSADYKAYLRSDEHEFAEGETLMLTNLDADGNVRRSEECPVIVDEDYDYPYVENPFTDGGDWHGGTVRGENDQVVGTVPWQE